MINNIDMIKWQLDRSRVKHGMTEFVCKGAYSKLAPLSPCLHDDFFCKGRADDNMNAAVPLSFSGITPQPEGEDAIITQALKIAAKILKDLERPELLSQKKEYLLNDAETLQDVLFKPASFRNLPPKKRVPNLIIEPQRLSTLKIQITDNNHIEALSTANIIHNALNHYIELRNETAERLKRLNMK